MPAAASYAVTIELTEMELALLYHAVVHDPGEYRTVFWRPAGSERSERHFVSRQWLENKLFGRIAEARPAWLEVMESAQKRLTPHAE